MAFAQAAFLPTATEAVIEETPPEHRGLAMALFSQCFAVSAIVAPLAGGALLDAQNNGLMLWLLMGLACLLMLPALQGLQPRYRNRLSPDVDASVSETVRESVQSSSGPR